MSRRVMVVAFDVDDAPNGPEHAVNETDLIDGIKARLDEFYPSDDLQPFVPADVRAVVLDPAAWSAWTAATIVGLDGAEDASGFDGPTLDAAWKAASDLAATPVRGEG